MLLYELGLPGHSEYIKPKCSDEQTSYQGQTHARPTTQTTAPVPRVLTGLEVLYFFFHCFENINRQLCYWYLQFVISFITEMQMAH